jgi:hypothetical protein
MPLDGLMSMWERKEHEADLVPQESTPPDWDAGDLDDDSWNHEDAFPELREYRDVLINSSAYAWLASALTAELQCETLGKDCRAEIRQTILNKLSTTDLVISRRKPPPSVSIRIHTPWNAPAFFRYQEYDIPPQEALPRALVLTGDGNNIQCSTIKEYMSQVWPHYGPEILKLYQRLVSLEIPGLNRCQYPTFPSREFNQRRRQPLSSHRNPRLSFMFFFSVSLFFSR